MKVAEVFRRPVDRRIEEVIKVELDDEAIVAAELEEYVATQRIVDSFESIIDAYHDRIDNPTEDVNVWVSGFFGSGKSSFAKVLGYLLGNPIVNGKPSCDWFFSHSTAPRVKQLLESGVHERAATIPIFVDMLSAKNVKNEGESVVLPLYRALLERLDYSTNLHLAELEFTLEEDGRLADFESAFERTFAKSWRSRRDVALAKNEASRILHELDSKTYASPDSFARTPFDRELTAQTFADRAVELLHRRGDGASRILFVVDEAGQYMARWVNRVGDLQGVAEAFQKRRGPLWMLATSQERLEDIVDSLEGNRTELGRIKDRFFLKVDLLPSDIEEVVTSRVLDKSNSGQQGVRDVFTKNRNKLNSHVKLASGTRGADLAEEQVIRLYPMVPYQVRLLIDAVSTRRAAGGNAGMMGGANRTIIRLAQQLLIDPTVGIRDADVGRLVTLDRVYDLLQSVIPPSWRDEVEQVEAQHGSSSLVASVLKAIALLVDVRDLPLTVRNIAAVLHPSMEAEALDADVQVALDVLVKEGRVRLDGTGYRVQSPEEKTWAESRKAIAARPADVNRLRKTILKERLMGLSVSAGRAFGVELTVGDEKLTTGEIPLVIEEADDTRRSDLVVLTREASQANRIWWTYVLSNETNQSLEELHKSEQMIARRDVASRTGVDAELIAQEKRRKEDWADKARRSLEADLVKGRAIFRGSDSEVPAGADVRAAAQKLVQDHLPSIYSQIDEFAASLKASDPLLVLRDVSLDGVPESLGPKGIRLVKQTPSGKEIDATGGPLPAVLAEIKNRDGYGTEVTGGLLLQHFGAPPFGAPTEVVQAIVAGAVRQGLVDVKAQGALIKTATDQRLDAVFKGPQAFRSAVFKPHEDTIGLEKRVDLAKKLTAITGTKSATDLAALAGVARGVFAPLQADASRVRDTLRGLGLVVPPAVEQVAKAVRDIVGIDDEVTVQTALANWDDLVAGRETVEQLSTVIDANLGDLQRAKRTVDAKSGLDDPQVLADHTELHDLLEAGDLPNKLGRIIALTGSIDAARTAFIEKCRAELAERVEHAQKVLAAKYPTLDQTIVTEALGQLELLIPGIGESSTPELLQARTESLGTTVDRVRQRLDEVVARDRLATVRASDVVSDLITTQEDLDAALERIRSQVESLLADGKQVRLT